MGPLLLNGTEASRLTRTDRALLSWLVMQRGMPVTAGWLARRVWPDEDEAVHRVAPTLARLRQFRIDVQELSRLWVLADTVAIDAVMFGDRVARARSQIAHGQLAAAWDNLAAALPLWRGTPYPDLSRHPDALEEIERLTAVRLDAFEARNHLMLRSDIDFRFVAQLHALAIEYPYRVILQHQLAIALARLGRAGQAIHVVDGTLARYQRAGNDRLGTTVELRRALIQRNAVQYDDPAGYS